MKLLFASDLHGSAYYAEKLEDLIRNEAPDKTVLLGDLLYHGFVHSMSSKKNSENFSFAFP